MRQEVKGASSGFRNEVMNFHPQLEGDMGIVNPKKGLQDDSKSKCSNEFPCIEEKSHL
jgi:hypothetical protein